MSALFADHLLSWMIAMPFLGMVALAPVRDRVWVLSVTLAIYADQRRAGFASVVGIRSCQ